VAPSALSPGSKDALGECDKLVQAGGKRRWPKVDNLQRSGAVSQIVGLMGRPYEVVLGIKRAAGNSQNKADRRRKKAQESAGIGDGGGGAPASAGGGSDSSHSSADEGGGGSSRALPVPAGYGGGTESAGRGNGKEPAEGGV